MGIRQLGPLIGGSISLALNANTSHTGKVSYNTYLGLIAISALGAPFALFLSQPEKVVRSDGTKIPYMRKTSLSIEARAIWKQLKSRPILLLVPVFLAGQFGVTYQGNYLTSKLSSRVSLTKSKTNVNISLLHRSLPSARIISYCNRRLRSEHDNGSNSRPEIFPNSQVQNSLRSHRSSDNRILDLERSRPSETLPSCHTTQL